MLGFMWCHMPKRKLKLTERGRRMSISEKKRANKGYVHFSASGIRVDLNKYIRSSGADFEITKIAKAGGEPTTEKTEAIEECLSQEKRDE